MKRNHLFVVGVVIIISFFGFSLNNSESDKDRMVMEIISYVLKQGHYSPKEINDSFSKDVYNHYLKSIDGQRRFFIQTDIAGFEEYKTLIDDEIKTYRFDFFDKTYQKYRQRIEQVELFYPSLLETPFDFSIKENLVLNFENMPYSESLSELKTAWRKRLKLSTLEIFYNKKEVEKDKKEEDSLYVPLSDIELEIEARKATKSELDLFFEQIAELERKDYLSVYINAITTQFDPHTYYFEPNEKDRFDTNMSGKFEGIGARLQKKNQKIEIIEALTGGPVWRDKLLESGDILLKVAQEGEEPVSLEGMRLEDAVKLIKGPKGTRVYLTVKKVNGSIEVVVVKRDVIELEEVFAKSAVILQNEKKYGLINLPKFYVDLSNYKNQNAAIDVKKEIKRLKEQNIEGLILDLRNNGGGSLESVIEMTGFFIDKGPVVQVKSTGGLKQVLENDKSTVIWDGPLVIMVNEFSASASEILAAALQDYKRAIIIGSEKTFGKGTVQKIVDLNGIISNNTYGDLGAMKITTDKFYRINGGSTQLKGVESDLVLPDRYAYIKTGEKDQDNPLVWDSISSATNQTWEKNIDYDYVTKRSKKRIENNSYFNLIKKQAQWIKNQQDDHVYFLDFEEYKKKIENHKKKTEKFKTISEFNSGITYKANLPFKKEKKEGEEKDIALEKKKRWEEALKKDLYIDEAVHVLLDLSKSE